jgi:hypothetical protein
MENFILVKEKTNKIEDGYLGSGRLINLAIQKYGRENFGRDIICFCDSQKELNEMEFNFITKEFLEINRKVCYNIAVGGSGGNVLANYTKEYKDKIYKKIGVGNKGKFISSETKKLISDSKLGVPSGRKGTKLTKEQCKNSGRVKGCLAWNKGIKMKPQSEEAKRKNSESNKGVKNYFYGKKHTNESLIKMRKPRKSSENIRKSQKGLRWFHKDNVTTKIKIEEAESYIQNGWKQGRK